MKKYSYEELMNKAEKCKKNARRIKSEHSSFWAFCYWLGVARRLEAKAQSMKLSDASNIKTSVICVENIMGAK